MVLAVVGLLVSACTSASGSRSEGVPPTVEDAVDLDEPDRVPLAPSTRDLIAAAVADGELEYHEGSLLRLYAQFQDDRLPQQYRSHGDGHDLALFLEISEALDELSEADRQAFQPFLLRPEQPGSIFNGGHVTAGSAKPKPAGHPGEGAFEVPAEPTKIVPVSQTVKPVYQSAKREARVCTEGWRSLAIGKNPEFRVWVCDRGPDVKADLAWTHHLVEKNWASMVNTKMGAPMPDQAVSMDHPDSDEAIDIYAVEPGWLGPERDRAGEERDLKSGSDENEVLGVTLFTLPLKRSASSAYILFDRSLLRQESDEELEHVLVHEIFHAQQFAHNVTLMTSPDHIWFYEASAVWAETYFLHETASTVHRGYLPNTQNSPHSLLASEPNWARYASYTWPLFMAQERGPDAVFEAWARLENATPATATALISQELDFSTNFADYALRVLNLDLDGKPAQPLFSDHDPEFPRDVTVPLRRHDARHVLTDHDDEVIIDYRDDATRFYGEVQPETPGVPGLSARYDHVKVTNPPRPGTSVRVEGDDELVDNDYVVVEALVREHDQTEFQRRRIALDGSDLCDAAELYLILSNTADNPDASATGSLRISMEGAPCAAVEGNLTITHDWDKCAEDGRHCYSGHTEVHMNIQLGEGTPARYHDAVLAAEPGDDLEAYEGREFLAHSDEGGTTMVATGWGKHVHYRGSGELDCSRSWNINSTEPSEHRSWSLILWVESTPSPDRIVTLHNILEFPATFSTEPCRDLPSGRQSVVAACELDPLLGGMSQGTYHDGPTPTLNFDCSVDFGRFVNPGNPYSGVETGSVRGELRYRSPQPVRRS